MSEAVDEKTIAAADSAAAATHATAAETTPASPDAEEYVGGWRLWVVGAGLWIALFLSTLETTIVSTALVSITDALDGFDQRDWVVTAYLITYTGFLVIFAKLSDIYGKKTMLLLAIAWFTIFSTVCGAVSSMTQLIIFRAGQGVGASGIYSMIMAIFPTLVPQAQHGKFVAVVSSVFVIASVLGPILGGAIATHASWRWVFLLNTPSGAVAWILVAAAVPSSKPGADVSMATHVRWKFSRAARRRVDVLGMGLLLCGSVLLVFALEESGSRYAWSSPTIIAPLVGGSVCLVCFVNWEAQLQKSASAQEPVFPLKLLKNRVLAGCMLTAFFIGFPFVAVVVNIPQRGQAVADQSPVSAGLTLLPLLLLSPVATVVSGVLTSNFKVPPAYLIVAGSAIQLVGMGLVSSLPTNTTSITAEQYGYEAIMGVGFGLGLSTVLTMAPLVVEKNDLPVTMGALTQVRVLGGTIGLAICSTVLNSHVSHDLVSVITPTQLQDISNSLSSIDSLTPSQQTMVRESFAEGYNEQMKIMAIFSGIAFLTALLVLERHPRKLA